MNANENDLEPVNISGLSLSSGPKKDAYKSGAVMARNAQFSGPMGMDFMSRQGQTQNQPLLMGNLNRKTGMNQNQQLQNFNNGNMKQQTYSLQVLNPMMPMAESKTENAQQAIFVPSKVKTQGLQEAPATLHLTSIAVTESPDAVLERVDALLSGAQFENTHVTDGQSYTVEGTAFSEGVPAHYKLVIYSNGAGSVVSALRQSGCHSVAFSNFFDWLEKKLTEDSSADELPSFGLPPLSMDMMSDEDSDFHSQQDLDMFVQDIQDDVYQVETLGLVLDLEGKVVAEYPALANAVQQCTQSIDPTVRHLACKICAKANIDIPAKQ